VNFFISKTSSNSPSGDELVKSWFVSVVILVFVSHIIYLFIVISIEVGLKTVKMTLRKRWNVGCNVSIEKACWAAETNLREIAMAPVKTVLPPFAACPAIS